MLDGYASDMTRTVFLGGPDALGRRAYAAVLQAVQRAEGRVRAGVAAAEVDAVARETIVDAGFAGEVYQHGTGHGVGLEVHEAPHVGRSMEGVLLAAGMAVTIEPGVYLPGWGGIRIEDVVVVEDEGCRVLTTTPKSILTV
jgi:Xaa-Pro aminopeptidase